MSEHMQLASKGVKTAKTSRFSPFCGAIPLVLSAMIYPSAPALAQESAPSTSDDSGYQERGSDGILLAALEPVYDRIVVTASKQDARRAAGSAHFIAPEDLETYEYNDINRILRMVPGVNIQEEDGYGLRPNIGLRGTGLDRSSKIALMEDGILIAPAPYSAPSAYYFPRAGRMESVEVVKGPAAIKYGPLTTGGAVHMFSTIVPEEFSGQVNFLYGEDNQTQVHANTGMTYRGWGGMDVGFMLETFQDRSDGFKQLDSGGNTGFDIQDYVGKLKLQSKPGAKINQSLEFKFQYSDEISDETYLGLTQADFDANPYRRYRASQLDEFDSEHRILQLTHNILFNDNIDLTTLVYRTDFQRNWYKLERAVDSVEGTASTSAILADPTRFADAFATLVGASGLVSADDALLLRANNREYYGQGIQTVLGVMFDLGETAHDLEFSIRYHEDEEDRFQWFDGYRMDNGQLIQTSAGVAGTESNRIGSAKAWAFFAQDKIEWNALTVTPGVRVEIIDLERKNYGTADPGRLGTALTIAKNDVEVVIPGIGVTYDLNDSTLLLAGVHKGFSPPSPGSTADAEESVNVELGFRKDFDFGGIELIGFYNDYSNLVGTCTASTGGGCLIGNQFDGGEVDVTGVEVTADWDLGEAFDIAVSIPLSLTYTYTNAEFMTNFVSGFGPWGSVMSGDRVPYIADHQINVGLGVVGDRWQTNLNINYTSETRAQAGQGPIPVADKIDGRGVVDVSASYDLTDRVTLYAKAENLLDETYIAARRPAGLRPGKPQTLSAGIKFAF